MYISNKKGNTKKIRKENISRESSYSIMATTAEA